MTKSRKGQTAKLHSNTYIRKVIKASYKVTGKTIPIIEINIEDLGDELLAYMKRDDIFYFKQFAVYKGIRSSVFNELAHKNSYFNDCFEKAKEIQEIKFIQYGMNCKNPAFPIFALKNTAGWRDVQEINNNIAITNLADIIRRAKKTAHKEADLRIGGNHRRDIPDYLRIIPPKQIQEAEFTPVDKMPESLKKIASRT